MVKEARTDARVAIFWHIPWPNAEVFGICPWQRELVDGLLGADLIGFHIQSHCNNFLETVDRALEALTEWDRFAVNRQGHITRVRPYPISVAFPENSQAAGASRNSGEERAALCAEMHIEASLLGVGVDRVDYTKGILERFRALERFFELNPAYQQRFTFVQNSALETHRVSQEAPLPRRDRTLLQGFLLLHGDLAARWNEPGGQGIRGFA